MRVLLVAIVALESAVIIVGTTSSARAVSSSFSSRPQPGRSSFSILELL